MPRSDVCLRRGRAAPRTDRYSITAQKPALCCQNKFRFRWLLPEAQIKPLSTSVKYPWVLNIHEWRRIKTVASGSVNPAFTAWILRQHWLSYSWLLSLFPLEKHNYISSFLQCILNHLAWPIHDWLGLPEYCLVVLPERQGSAPSGLRGHGLSGSGHRCVSKWETLRRE